MTEEKSKRELILEAAAVVFGQHGYHNAKMEEIACKAGVGKGTVYEYFVSKQELFQNLYIYGTERFIREISAEIACCPDARTKLTRIILLHCKNMIDSRDLARITMDGFGQLDSSFQKSMLENQLQKHFIIKQIVEEGINAGEFCSDHSSRSIALAFSGAMGTIFHLAIFHELAEEDLIAQAEEIFAVIFRGITA